MIVRDGRRASKSRRTATPAPNGTKQSNVTSMLWHLPRAEPRHGQGLASRARKSCDLHGGFPKGRPCAPFN